MAGSRLLPLLTGLWACAAFAQGTLTAAKSILLDGGNVARAYVVTSGGSQFAMANAGRALQVFNAAGAELLPAQSGTFATFAVANGVTVGAGTTTLVVAADIGANCPTVCLDIFYWDSTARFQLQTAVVTNVLNVTAMTIDATSSPIRIYYATSTPQLYEQDITISAAGSVVVGGAPPNRSVPNIAQGLTINPPSTLYLSDTNSSLYTFPSDLTNPGGGVFANPTCAPGGFCQIEGLFYSSTPVPTVLAGGVGSGVYFLDPVNAASIVQKTVQILSVSGATTQPSAASLDATANLMLVTEDQSVANGGPWLHLVLTDAGPGDGGPPDGGPADAGSADAGICNPDGGFDDGGACSNLDSGLPTIPSIPPGPGQDIGTTNSCNCSTARGTPLFLALLLPLFARRRR
jgi:MYXO-CTERM domain-containing protein